MLKVVQAEGQTILADSSGFSGNWFGPPRLGSVPMFWCIHTLSFELIFGFLANAQWRFFVQGNSTWEKLRLRNDRAFISEFWFNKGVRFCLIGGGVAMGEQPTTVTNPPGALIYTGRSEPMSLLYPNEVVVDVGNIGAGVPYRFTAYVDEHPTS